MLPKFFAAKAPEAIKMDAEVEQIYASFPHRPFKDEKEMRVASEQWQSELQPSQRIALNLRLWPRILRDHKQQLRKNFFYAVVNLLALSLWSRQIPSLGLIALIFLLWVMPPGLMVFLLRRAIKKLEGGEDIDVRVEMMMRRPKKTNLR